MDDINLAIEKAVYTGQLDVLSLAEASVNKECIDYLQHKQPSVLNSYNLNLSFFEDIFLRRRLVEYLFSCMTNSCVSAQTVVAARIRPLRRLMNEHPEVGVMVEYMQDITDEHDRMIRNIGNEEAFIEEIPEPALIPLPNGRCGKAIASGICDHANACYSCGMFRPDKTCMSIYQMHLREAENNIAIAELHGYERLLQINTEIRDNLQRIISRLQNETEEREDT